MKSSTRNILIVVVIVVFAIAGYVYYRGGWKFPFTENFEGSGDPGWGPSARSGMANIGPMREEFCGTCV